MSTVWQVEMESGIQKIFSLVPRLCTNPQLSSTCRNLRPLVLYRVFFPTWTISASLTLYWVFIRLSEVCCLLDRLSSCRHRLFTDTRRKTNVCRASGEAFRRRLIRPRGEQKHAVYDVTREVNQEQDIYAPYCLEKFSGSLKCKQLKDIGVTKMWCTERWINLLLRYFWLTPTLLWRLYIDYQLDEPIIIY